jgi:hypothetical protein
MKDWTFTIVGNYLTILDAQKNFFPSQLVELNYSSQIADSSIFELTKKGKEFLTFFESDNFTCDGIVKTYSEVQTWLMQKTGESNTEGSSSGGLTVYSTNTVSAVEFTNADPQTINILCAEIYIEFYGSNGKLDGVVVSDKFGRGMTSQDNITYSFTIVAPDSGSVLVTYGVKAI